MGFHVTDLAACGHHNRERELFIRSFISYVDWFSSKEMSLKRWVSSGGVCTSVLLWGCSQQASGVPAFLPGNSSLSFPAVWHSCTKQPQGLHPDRIPGWNTAGITAWLFPQLAPRTGGKGKQGVHRWQTPLLRWLLQLCSLIFLPEAHSALCFPACQRHGAPPAASCNLPPSENTFQKSLFDTAEQSWCITSTPAQQAWCKSRLGNREANNYFLKERFQAACKQMTASFLSSGEWLWHSGNEKEWSRVQSLLLAWKTFIIPPKPPSCSCKHSSTQHFQAQRSLPSSPPSTPAGCWARAQREGGNFHPAGTQKGTGRGPRTAPAGLLPEVCMM